MTTATAVEAAKVDLASVNGQEAPKRRGRPPGSKNKSTVKAVVRKTRVTVKAATPTISTREVTQISTASTSVHAVLIGNDGVELLNVDGSTEIAFSVSLAGALLFDRRK